MKCHIFYEKDSETEFENIFNKCISLLSKDIRYLESFKDKYEGNIKYKCLMIKEISD